MDAFEPLEPLELDELEEELDSDFFAVDFLSEPPEDLVSEDFLADDWLAVASALESVR